MEALICGQCGGQLKAKEGTFKELDGGGFFYFGDDHLQCEFCKTEYKPNSQVPKYVKQVTQTVVADNAIVIGGDVVSSNIIMATGINTNRVGKKRRRQ